MCIVASEMEGFIMKEIKCAHCGEIVHIDNSDYEKMLILLEKRVAEKEMIITELRRALECCHKKLSDINKENPKVEILPKKDVKFNIDDQEEISKIVKMLDKLNIELLEKNKKFEEMYSLKICDDESKLKALQNIRNEIQELRDTIIQKQTELSFLELRAEKANSLV